MVSPVNRLLRILKHSALYLAVAALGFVVGATALYIQWARSGPTVQPWHRLELMSELSAGRADLIQGFDDYLALEERLFAELDARVFDVTPTGPDQAIVRYSSGSASDPRKWPRNWNRTFVLAPPGDPLGGVLLLHGMSDSPYSLRALGEMLSRQGYLVVGLRYPGHGTIPAGMRSVTWEDMAAAVRLAMAHLSNTLGARPIHLIGYSTGASLALDFTLDALDGIETPVPASQILVSPAIGVTPLAALTPWLDRLSRLPGLESVAWTSLLPEFDPFNYNSFAANAAVQVHRMTRSVARRVRALAERDAIEGFPPTLALLTAVDATVLPAAVADRLLNHLPPGRNALLLYDINRFAIKSPLIVSDPGPSIERLMQDASVPFAVTLIGNESPDSRQVVARHKPALAASVTRTEPLGLAWPDDVISLSHVDLPFPPDDPLYGRDPPEGSGRIFLGQLAIRGERGVLKVPGQWLLRLRHNPFYYYQAHRVLDWIKRGSAAAQVEPASSASSPVTTSTSFRSIR